MDDHRRRRASDRPSSGRRFGWQLEELVLSAGLAPVRPRDRTPNAGQSSVSASLSLSPCRTQTPREPGSFQLSFLLKRSTPPRERGFVNLFLLGTSKKITISERGAVSSGPRERPRLTRARRHQPVGVAQPQRLRGVGALSRPAAAPVAHCRGSQVESLPAGLRYTHRRQPKASSPGCAGFGRWGAPIRSCLAVPGLRGLSAAVVWKSCGLRGPCGSDGPSGCVRRSGGRGEAGFGARQLPPTRQTRGSCRRCRSERTHAC